MLAMADEFHEMDKLEQHGLLAQAMKLIRETLLVSAGTPSLMRSRDEEQAFVKKFSTVMRLSAVEKAYQLLNDAGYHLERNGSAKMIFLDMSVRLAKAMN